MVTKHGFLITMVISVAVGALILAYSAPVQAGSKGSAAASPPHQGHNYGDTSGTSSTNNTSNTTNNNTSNTSATTGGGAAKDPMAVHRLGN